ncbi:hypothetical protein PUNSTDRAFT_112482 [Punctularia strigosozonata HHB-11173 SS5]|uniref:uncharacterized protein n=1 Tax=Punctularia strigosozonata (strain HHB-11173) TaxID=741275 RepID=UPI0004417D3F|nr:uncharacterized protein PUNSTDRAFT_112482 [Punctularia strigosozonata HHB-11173 SS5]EIN10658.1 hypothetical protein PUNSTDRAFT_112482 [Punctularia strigosozonata HHB-11173 SS5]
MRTFRVNQIMEGSNNQIEMYKFSHPFPGNLMMSNHTTFERRNHRNNIWELAGEIAWRHEYSAKVIFGIEEYELTDLRRRKKSTSESRRFKVDDKEYKWKKLEQDDELVTLTCINSRGNVVAVWDNERSTLSVDRDVYIILDRIVVTCMLNLWLWVRRRW